jgi:hypothetical protein
MNVEIGTKTPIFLFWEYLFRNFGILSLQCPLHEMFLGNRGKNLRAKKLTGDNDIGLKPANQSFSLLAVSLTYRCHL